MSKLVRTKRPSYSKMMVDTKEFYSTRKALQIAKATLENIYRHPFNRPAMFKRMAKSTLLFLETQGH